MSQTNSNINLDQLIDSNSAPGESLYDEPVIVLIPPTNNNEPDIIKEVESLEQQALKLSFEQELVNISESNNKDLNLPKKNNEMHEVKSNSKAIRLYSRDKINEIIQLLQAPPPTKNTANKETINKYHYTKKMWYLTPTEPVQLAKIIEPPPLVPLVVVAIEDLFDICMLVHRNVGYQGVSIMEKEAKKFYYNVSRPIITIFLKYSNEYQIKRRKIKTAGQVHKPIISEQ